MKQIDTPRAANAYGGPAGGTGHFQDTDVLGGTQLDAEWCEGMQNAITELIAGLGGALAGDETGQVWGLLQYRVQGVEFASADTGAVTNSMKRGVVVSTASRATGTDSAALASFGSVASGADSACVAASSGTASGAKSAVVASSNSTASGVESAAIATESSTAFGVDSIVAASNAGTSTGSTSAVIATETGETVGISCVTMADLQCFAGPGTRAVVVASRNCENIEAETVALGYSAGAIVKKGANQNRTVILRANPGEVETVGRVIAGGGLEIAGTTQAAAFGAPWTVTNNVVAGAITIDFNGHDLAAASAALQYCIVTNSKVDAGSRVKITVDFAGTNGFPVVHTAQFVGGFDLWFANVHPTTAVTSTVTVHFDVINPA